MVSFDSYDKIAEDENSDMISLYRISARNEAKQFHKNDTLQILNCPNNQTNLMMLLVEYLKGKLKKDEVIRACTCRLTDKSLPRFISLEFFSVTTSYNHTTILVILFLLNLSSFSSFSFFLSSFVFIFPTLP